MLLKLGAITTIKNRDGEKASDMTVDPEIKFILDYFDQYQEIIKNKEFLHLNYK
jgi:hypothetical protein